jgi:hypothetical protein
MNASLLAKTHQNFIIELPASLKFTTEEPDKRDFFLSGQCLSAVIAI